MYQSAVWYVVMKLRKAYHKRLVGRDTREEKGAENKEREE